MNLMESTQGLKENSCISNFQNLSLKKQEEAFIYASRVGHIRLVPLGLGKLKRKASS